MHKYIATLLDMYACSSVCFIKNIQLATLQVLYNSRIDILFTSFQFHLHNTKHNRVSYYKWLHCPRQSDSAIWSPEDLGRRLYRICRSCGGRVGYRVCPVEPNYPLQAAPLGYNITAKQTKINNVFRFFLTD